MWEPKVYKILQCISKFVFVIFIIPTQNRLGYASIHLLYWDLSISNHLLRHFINSSLWAVSRRASSCVRDLLVSCSESFARTARQSARQVLDRENVRASEDRLGGVLVSLQNPATYYDCTVTNDERSSKSIHALWLYTRVVRWFFLWVSWFECIHTFEINWIRRLSAGVIFRL
jgi:hypothetical protein